MTDREAMAREHAMGCPCATCSKKLWNEIYQLGYQRGRREGLEEAAKVADTASGSCIDQCLPEVAQDIRALAEGQK